MADQENPLTCEYFPNHPATQVLSADLFGMGRHTTFCCAQCGDEQEGHVRRIDPHAVVWRFTITPITPIKEKADA
ncbi:hypothetical protein FXF51_05940 [Nonomuraea sp. PA05]|uniref:hypothetical protein n=1 Tax=Nonomuraea sp. PA05 TaxID=2604466 RepID=UPI0011D69D92|nr:hypothetical protein [Nonomuraea sp. PA05]TYB69701.1 hypothetical protein FXF51_05940 [Nonomuraea sp. PA05]